MQAVNNSGILPMALASPWGGQYPSHHCHLTMKSRPAVAQLSAQLAHAAFGHAKTPRRPLGAFTGHKILGDLTIAFRQRFVRRQLVLNQAKALCIRQGLF